MEKFIAFIKANNQTEKIRKVSILSMDHYNAHKNVLSKLDIKKEDIIYIKDSKGNEVFNLDKGFIFDE